MTITKPRIPCIPYDLYMIWKSESSSKLSRSFNFRILSITMDNSVWDNRWPTCAMQVLWRSMKSYNLVSGIFNQRILGFLEQINLTNDVISLPIHELKYVRALRKPKYISEMLYGVNTITRTRWAAESKQEHQRGYWIPLKFHFWCPNRRSNANNAERTKPSSFCAVL